MDTKLKLILASNSPRRKKILTDLKLNFEVIPSNFDEKLEDDIFSYEKIEDLATKKCLDVVNRVDKDSLVLAADTVVVLHNKILGKPHSREEAYKMLEALSGQITFSGDCLLRYKYPYKPCSTSVHNKLRSL